MPGLHPLQEGTGRLPSPKGFPVPVPGGGDAACGEGPQPGAWHRAGPWPSPAPEPATPSRAPTLRLTAVGVWWPSKLGEGAGLAGQGHVVVQEAAAAREAVFRGTASHLRTEEWARRSGPAHPDPLPSPPPNSTHQACVSAPQRHDGASKARSQSPVAGQQPVYVR